MNSEIDIQELGREHIEDKTQFNYMCSQKDKIEGHSQNFSRQNHINIERAKFLLNQPISSKDSQEPLNSLSKLGNG